MGAARCAALVALTLSAAHAAPACADFERALSLARAGNRSEARALLLGCAAAEPREPRYLVELAGIAYLESRHSEARQDLHRALRLKPDDTYANDFLGTLYYLDRNIAAALKYWNRASKPRLAATALPERISLKMLELPPRAQLLRDDLDTVHARLEALRLGPVNARLDARDDGDFELQLTAASGGLWTAAARSLKGLAWQSVTPDWRNAGGSGVSWLGQYRWDARKRRVASAVTVPLSRDGKWRLEAGVDARRETWNMGEATDFRLDSTTVTAAVGAVESARFDWFTGLRWSTRDFSGAPDSGRTIESIAGARFTVLDRPESRYRVDALIDGGVGRFAVRGAGNHGNARGNIAVESRWSPRRFPGTDAVILRASTGGMRGEYPLDQRFVLGVERDTPLWLRAHPATRDGKKGAGLFGTSYVLFNAQYDREMFRAPFVTVSLGPLLDVGRVNGAAWQVNAGAQLSVSMLGRVALVLSWAADVRSGRGAWYVSSGLPRAPFATALMP